ncbi:bromodomain-containing protein 2 [Drosophila novamexicana]|uniref:bromodomain-containing protein 2 n=1 Tax=Drosophila novamexicana TaxID=47314 RepID=UPI0011E5CECB|nr:bromodomain-containing protein 2 [Drosophila novamexicana]
MMSSTKRGKPTPEISACKAIIRNLFSKKYKSLAWVFYEPLDADLLGLYDYHLIVKEPMDLSTIKYRLNSNFYLNAIDFARDVRLIFYNTYIYTGPGHLCYEMAKNLQLVFEDMYAKVPLHDNSNESCNWSDSSSSDLDIKEVYGCSSSPSQSKEGSVTVVPDNTQARNEDLAYKEWKKEDHELPMTTEEDLELHIRVQQLDGVMLLNVIHMITQMEGINFGYANKELEFDVRNLKTLTKRAILAYMASKGITGKRVSRLKKSYQ